MQRFAAITENNTVTGYNSEGADNRQDVASARNQALMKSRMIIAAMQGVQVRLEVDGIEKFSQHILQHT